MPASNSPGSISWTHRTRPWILMTCRDLERVMVSVSSTPVFEGPVGLNPDPAQGQVPGEGVERLDALAARASRSSR